MSIEIRASDAQRERERDGCKEKDKRNDVNRDTGKECERVTMSY